MSLKNVPHNTHHSFQNPTRAHHLSETTVRTMRLTTRNTRAVSARRRNNTKTKTTSRTAKRATKCATKSRRRRTNIQTGGASSGCAAGINYAPYNYSSFNNYRGNHGDSIPVAGATVPQNIVQRLANWFDGKSSMFTPSRFDATSQTGVQYQSQQAAAAAASVQPLSQRTSKLYNINGAPITYRPFASASDKANSAVSSMIPNARAGGNKRHRQHRRRRVNRASRKHRFASRV